MVCNFFSIKHISLPLLLCFLFTFIACSPSHTVPKSIFNPTKAKSTVAFSLSFAWLDQYKQWSGILFTVLENFTSLTTPRTIELVSHRFLLRLPLLCQYILLFMHWCDMPTSRLVKAVFRHVSVSRLFEFSSKPNDYKWPKTALIHMCVRAYMRDPHTCAIDMITVD